MSTRSKAATFHSEEVTIFIDSGSSETYVTKELAKDLDLRLGPDRGRREGLPDAPLLTLYYLEERYTQEG